MDVTIIFYLIPACLATVGLLRYDLSDHSRGKRLLWVALYLYLVLLMGLRFEVGGDTLTYMSWFTWAHSLAKWEPFNPANVFEPGFTFICACVKSLGGEFYHLQIVHAIIINSCLFFFISKNTKYWFSALLVAFLTYYIYFSTEILREAIAIFIFVLNFKSFEERRWGRFYLGVVCCIFFHLSASFLLVLPLLSRLKFNRSYIWAVGIFIALCMFLKPLFSMVSDIAPAVGAKAEGYGKHTYVGYIWVGLRLIQFTIIPYLTLLFCKKIFRCKPKFEIAYLIIMLMGIGIIFVPIIFQRFTNYYYPLLSLSLADVLCRYIKSLRLNRRVAALVLTLLITVGYGSYYFHLGFYKRWIPYSSIINPVSYSFRQKFINGGG